uniref:Pepsin inhibitor-3-like repeated domain-containing protein n=1 Tax=Ditylenchus dipsaci TaxID=166011 RepID=A0A915CU91_9BILA
MKCLITAFIATVFLLVIGGNVGCVVSENSPGNASLFINSHFTKYLSEDEQSELEQYKQDLAKFKTEVKTFLEQRQKQALEARQQGRPNSFGGRANGPAEPTEVDNKTSAPLKQPQQPKKPSFCSEKATTQYVFDGCSVQGDNVYIGNNLSAN